MKNPISMQEYYLRYWDHPQFLNYFCDMFLRGHTPGKVYFQVNSDSMYIEFDNATQSANITLDTIARCNDEFVKSLSPIERLLLL